jgi:small subunit ribosomal protein S16
MQRTGRKGHTQFRVIVQESRLNPSSGRVVAQLGSYNPHTKEALLDIEKASTFLNNGAQPSSRVALLLQKQGVKLPDWVKIDSSKTHAIKNTEKLRRNQPAKEVVAEVEVAPVAEEPAEEATLAE